MNPIYTGDYLREYNATLGIDAYIPSPELVQAVETARLLQRPLLLRGEPGCGKTRLAEAVAVELHHENYRDFYFPWPIKSTTKAREGLYEFDHLERLRDVNAGDEDPTKERYLKYGPIGQAFRKMNDSPADSPPPVILIDEIDKADIDFPNDLLWELDRKEFFVPEVKDVEGNPLCVRVDKKNGRSPIVIITSNDEKDLPGAFLRRCLFHYITFPDDNRLKEIVEKRLAGLSRPRLSANVLDEIVTRFRDTRQKLEKTAAATRLPSTSELLDWAQIVAIYLSQPDWRLDDEMNLRKEEAKKGKDTKEDKIIRPEDVLLKSYDDYRAMLGGKKDSA